MLYEIVIFISVMLHAGCNEIGSNIGKRREEWEKEGENKIKTQNEKLVETDRDIW